MEKDHFLLIEKTLKQIRKFIQRELLKKGFDISAEQLSLLNSCFENPNQTQIQLAETIVKDPASVTRMIDILERKGFITRKSVNNDRRSYGICLTESGTTMITSIQPLYRDMLKYSLKNVSPTGQKLFPEILERMYLNLE